MCGKLEPLCLFLLGDEVSCGSWLLKHATKIVERVLER